MIIDSMLYQWINSNWKSNGPVIFVLFAERSLKYRYNLEISGHMKKATQKKQLFFSGTEIE